MKLLFVSNLFPDTAEPYRGLDNATLLHHLADRWQIRVLAVRPALRPGKWRCREEDARFRPRYVPVPYVPKVGSRWNHRLMARALRHHLLELRRDFPFDVVLCSWIFPDCCAVAELATEQAFPFVAIAQGSDVHQYLRMPARRAIIGRLLPRAAAIITRSGELARLLVAAGLPVERVHPVYNGVDLRLFRPGVRPTARRGLALPAGVPIVLFVGNFYEIKNPLLPPAALSLMPSSAFSQPPMLVMIGGGEWEGKARHCARHLSVADRVVFAGRCDAGTVARHMRAANVLCLPSKNEGVPNVILEAFASGLPVVASRVGGIPEVHPGNDFGRLVPEITPEGFARALQDVLLSPPAPEPIHAHAQQFSWERAAAAYHEHLCQAAGT